MKEKIKKIIDSCIHQDQLRTARKFVNLAYEQKQIDERLFTYFTVMIEEKIDELNKI